MQGNELNNNHLEDYVGISIVFSFDNHEFVHRMHGSITFRKGGSISYEGPHLHCLCTSKERFRESFQVLMSF